MSWPTVRRFPRTLSDAFRGVDYAVSIHRVGRPVPFGERVLGAIVATVIGVLLACALVHWWTGVNT